ncbi:MAG: hypothetical protein ACKOPN_09020 [Prochlorococcaceae cyanobacterium]
MEDRPGMQQSMAGLHSGLDFANAQHHASCRTYQAIDSFNDSGFASRTPQINSPPREVSSHRTLACYQPWLMP